MSTHTQPTWSKSARTGSECSAAARCSSAHWPGRAMTLPTSALFARIGRTVFTGTPMRRGRAGVRHLPQWRADEEERDEKASLLPGPLAWSRRRLRFSCARPASGC